MNLAPSKKELYEHHSFDSAWIMFKINHRKRSSTQHMLFVSEFLLLSNHHYLIYLWFIVNVIFHKRQRKSSSLVFMYWKFVLVTLPMVFFVGTNRIKEKQNSYSYKIKQIKKEMHLFISMVFFFILIRKTLQRFVLTKKQ